VRASAFWRSGLQLCRRLRPRKIVRRLRARDPFVTMGANDRRHCLGGWWKASKHSSESVRWINQEGHVLLKAPQQPIFVGVDLYLPRRLRPRSTWRFTVLDYWVGGEVGPYVDVCFRGKPGRRQTFEFILPSMPPEGSDVELIIGVEPPPGRWSRALRPYWPERSAAVHRMWLRGNRIEPQEVTVVVLNWNRGDETVTCLESLAQADLRGASVLVVDNGSRDGSVERIRTRFPEQEILRLPQNEGYAGGNNAGILAALRRGAKAVLLLNNDTQVAADFLHPLLWTLNANTRAAAVSSAIMRMDHPDILDIAYLDVYFGHGIVYQRGVNALPGEGFDTRKEVDVAVGCSVLMTAEALNHVGILNESYFAYHEEVDWCLRARRAGYQIFYDPYSRVYHGGSKSSEALARPAVGERTTVSRRQLNTSVALSWNPIRAYLGARNTVRFVRLHGNLRQRIYFWLSSLYAAPLEALAAILRQEQALKIGAFGYRRALSVILFGPEPEGVEDIAKGLLAAPVSLFWRLPREARRAHREGRTAQVVELLRGLWDGIRDRPLPLRRLGLR
jgi:GT2 family glycosyltransferase